MLLQPQVPQPRHCRAKRTHRRHQSTHCRPTVQVSASAPQDWTQVAPWARQRFRDLASASNGVPDHQVPTAHACMLIALEEEAVVEMHPELREVLMAQTGLRIPTRAGAATWSLSRLTSLAHQVHNLLLQGQRSHQSASDLSSLPAADRGSLLVELNLQPKSDRLPTVDTADIGSTAPSENATTDATNVADSTTPEDSSSTSGAAAASTPAQSAVSTGLEASNCRLPHGLFQGDPQRVVQAINTVLFDWHGYGPCNRYGNPRDLHLSSVMEGGLGCSTALTILYMEVAALLGVSLTPVSLEGGRYWLLAPQMTQPAPSAPAGQGSSTLEVSSELSQNPAPPSTAPATAPGSLPAGRCQDNTPPTTPTPSQASTPASPDTSQQADVPAAAHSPPQSQPDHPSEDQQVQQPHCSPSDTVPVADCGPGGPSQASQTQQPHCDNSTLPHQPDSQGSTAHPDASPLTWLIDPYGQGELLTTSDVYDLFGVSPEELQQGSSRRSLLSSLLSDLRDAYWARAVGCSASPALMTPLDLGTALDNRVGTFGHSHALERALAAAEKTTWLEPQNSDHQLKFALLHYHLRRWDDAWLELGLFLERHRACGGHLDTVPRLSAAGTSETHAVASVETADEEADRTPVASEQAQHGQQLQGAEVLLEKIRLQLSVTATA